jgi:hypothetical protein
LIKHRQLARRVRAFGAIAFESSMDLKIKIHLQQLEFTLLWSAMGRRDDVFQLPATRINVMKPVSVDRHIMVYQVK